MASTKSAFFAIVGLLVVTLSIGRKLEADAQGTKGGLAAPLLAPQPTKGGGRVSSFRENIAAFKRREHQPIQQQAQQEVSQDDVQTVLSAKSIAQRPATEYYESARQAVEKAVEEATKTKGGQEEELELEERPQVYQKQQEQHQLQEKGQWQQQEHQHLEQQQQHQPPQADSESTVYGSIGGVPGKDFPGYTSIPNTKFSCLGLPYDPGMYADEATGCQVYHLCYQGRKESFLCGIGTIFNQAIMNCDFWHSADCSKSSQFYHLNAGFGKPSSEPASTFRGGALQSKTNGQERPQIPLPVPVPAARRSTVVVNTKTISSEQRQIQNYPLPAQRATDQSDYGRPIEVLSKSYQAPPQFQKQANYGPARGQSSSQGVNRLGNQRRRQRNGSLISPARQAKLMSLMTADGQLGGGGNGAQLASESSTQFKVASKAGVSVSSTMIVTQAAERDMSGAAKNSTRAAKISPQAAATAKTAPNDGRQRKLAKSEEVGARFGSAAMKTAAVLATRPQANQNNSSTSLTVATNEIKTSNDSNDWRPYFKSKSLAAGKAQVATATTATTKRQPSLEQPAFSAATSEANEEPNFSSNRPSKPAPSSESDESSTELAPSPKVAEDRSMFTTEASDKTTETRPSTTLATPSSVVTGIETDVSVAVSATTPTPDGDSVITNGDEKIAARESKSPPPPTTTATEMMTSKPLEATSTPAPMIRANQTAASQSAMSEAPAMDKTALPTTTTVAAAGSEANSTSSSGSPEARTPEAGETHGSGDSKSSTPTETAKLSKPQDPLPNVASNEQTSQPTGATKANGNKSTPTKTATDK